MFLANPIDDGLLQCLYVFGIDVMPTFLENNTLTNIIGAHVDGGKTQIKLLDYQPLLPATHCLKVGGLLPEHDPTAHHADALDADALAVLAVAGCARDPGATRNTTLHFWPQPNRFGDVSAAADPAHVVPAIEGILCAEVCVRNCSRQFWWWWTG